MGGWKISNGDKLHSRHAPLLRGEHPRAPRQMPLSSHLPHGFCIPSKPELSAANLSSFFPPEFSKQRDDDFPPSLYIYVFLTGDYSGLKGERVSNSVRRESGWKDWERGLDDERPSRILFFVGRRDRSRIFHRGLFARETRAAAAAAVDLQNAIDWRLGLHR